MRTIESITCLCSMFLETLKPAREREKGEREREEGERERERWDNISVPLTLYTP